jgi:glucose-1-phosphate adenylyltransferase
MEKLLTVILAGGEGKRLLPLTNTRSKSAVPFGGKYRIIDFTLSNCINSGIHRIFVLTQYRSSSLARHVQEGWGISSSGLDQFIYCVPAQQKIGMSWYRGTADALRQNLDLIVGRDIDNILILSGDHIYKMDYRQMFRFHKKNKADLTIATVRVKKESAAGALGVVQSNKQWRMVGFEEKPADPKTIEDDPERSLVSMGVYIFKTEVLIEVLKLAKDDFGNDVIPYMIGKRNNVYVFDYENENRITDYIVEVKEGVRKKTLVSKTRDSSYWRDVGSIESYYTASMDLVGVDPSFNLYGEKWAFRTYHKNLPPTKFILGGNARESLVSDGCIVSGGHVWRSILSPGVIIEREARIDESIVFDNTIIEPGASVNRAIIDKNVVVGSGCQIGYDVEADRKRGLTVTESGIVVVSKNAVIKSSDALY